MIATYACNAFARQTSCGIIQLSENVNSNVGSIEFLCSKRPKSEQPSAFFDEHGKSMQNFSLV